MKNTIILASALFVAVASGAQTSSDSVQHRTQNVVVVAAVTTDNALNSAYVADPQSLKGITTETLRPEHAFPVLGSYTATNASTGNLTVTLDPANKGIVWVEGLTQGKFKAFMKKAPATYKIPAQKSDSGKDIAEGTLFFNPASKELTVVLGRPFDEQDPTSFTAATSKQKGWQYTGVKSGVATNTLQAPQQ